MLNVRRFVKGADESLWDQVLNTSRRDSEEWGAIAVEELLPKEKRPGFDFEGRFIAELDGKSVGLVHADVDRLSHGKQGLIRLSVIPEFLGIGIERQLLETGLAELKARGMTTAQAWADSENRDYIQLLGSLGFKRVRVSSTMEMDLTNVSQSIGENEHVVIEPLQRDREEDIELINRLDNEIYKEHFNFRPDTLEETRYFLFGNPYFKERETFFAVLNGERIGYVTVCIDEKYSLEKNVKAGRISSVGVLKKYRGRGIGARLMLHGLKILKAKGMTRVVLHVDDYNPTKPFALYAKAGFSVKKKDFTYERKLQILLAPALLLE
jgi:mycothiol synthase